MCKVHLIEVVDNQASSIMNTLKISHKLRSELRHQGRAELKRAGFPEEISPLEELEDFVERVFPLALEFLPFDPILDERADLLWRLKIAKDELNLWFDGQIAALEANKPI
jgi:hypothetical protein